MVKSGKPVNDLATVKELVACGNYVVSKRVMGYLVNHDYAYDETVEDVVAAIVPGDFFKSSQLKHMPGVYADIYRHVKCYGEEWYVKLFLEATGEAIVLIWSLKEEGYGF